MSTGTGWLSRASAWWLIFANLIPIYGVLQFGWSVGELLLLYWLETVVIGVFGIAKLVGARRKRGIPWWTVFSRLPKAIFFCIHFGGFSAAHLLFLREVFDVPELDRFLLYAVLGLAASHAFSFLSNYLGKREFITEDETQFMLAPYGRVVIMHVVVIAGAALVEKTGSTFPALLLLIALKTVVDLAAHIREHRKAEAKRVAELSDRNAALSEALGLAAQARGVSD